MWKKIVIVLGVSIVGILCSLTIMSVYHSIKFQKLYDSLLKEEVDVLFLGRPTCGFCTLFKPILEDISHDYNVEYRYINTDELTKKELEKVLDKLEIRKKTFSTPRLIITKNGKIEDSYIGYMDDISLFHFFKKNGLIKEEIEYQNPYPNIERLSSNSYFELIEKKESTNILVGRIGDSKTNQLLKEANEKKLNLKFLNPGIFITEEDSNHFKDTIKDLKEDTTLPIVLVLEKGKVTKIIEDIKLENLE